MAKKPKTSEEVGSSLDLHLAWQRTKLDHPNRCFVTHPHLISWVESHLEDWLNALRTDVQEGYQPRDSIPCDSPKPGWMVRPGSVLELTDEVIFNGVISHFYAQIWQALRWSQGSRDIAYQLKPPTSNSEWMKSGFRVWREWRQKSLNALKKDVQFVVFADIAGFYENIDLPRLNSDLAALGVDQALLDKILMPCLNRWAQPRGKGIPQGYSGSDILAKVYMNPVDRGLRNAGFRHLRYVDDIRIFCRSNLEAKRALLKLNDLLRNRGLNLQTAKTKILRADEARHEIDGVAPVIQTIHKQLSEQLKELYANSSYATLEDIERLMELDPDAPSPEVLEQAFHDHFLSASGSGFDKTLFHYLLTRLGKTNSTVAIDYCLDLLASRPDETEHVLRYFREIDLPVEQCDAIVRYASSPDAIYNYQLYQIVRWFYERFLFPDELVNLCREWAFDRNREPWLRSYSLAVLGAAGDASDLEMIEEKYRVAGTEIEKAEIVAALTRMETRRRNSFYGRIKNDGKLVQQAIEQARHKLAA